MSIDRTSLLASSLLWGSFGASFSLLSARLHVLDVQILLFNLVSTRILCAMPIS